MYSFGFDVVILIQAISFTRDIFIDMFTSVKFSLEHSLRQVIAIVTTIGRDQASELME